MPNSKRHPTNKRPVELNTVMIKKKAFSMEAEKKSYCARLKI